MLKLIKNQIGEEMTTIDDGSIIFKERIKMKKANIDTFVGWIESHNYDPQYKWNWNDPKSVIEQFVHCVSEGATRGSNINLEPVFQMFFSQGYSGMDMTMGGPETIWLDYFKKQNEIQ